MEGIAPVHFAEEITKTKGKALDFPLILVENCCHYYYILMSDFNATAVIARLKQSHN